jgi:hypothetical protein
MVPKVFSVDEKCCGHKYSVCLSASWVHDPF